MTFWRNVNVISVLAHPRNFQDMLMKLFFSFAPFSTAWKFPDQKWLQQRRLQQWGWQKRWWCFHTRWLEKSCHLLRSSGFGLIQTGNFLLILKLGTLNWFRTSALCSNNEYYFNQSVQIISWWMISQPIGMFLATSLWICKGENISLDQPFVECHSMNASILVKNTFNQWQWIWNLLINFFSFKQVSECSIGCY